MNNKELINAGHELAKAISADTPIIEIAKMVTRLATALDVQQARANALAAENAGLNEFISAECWIYDMDVEQYRDAVDYVPETPATDAFLAEVRAQGADECVRKLVTSDDDDFSDAPNICAMMAYQLRKGVQS